MQLLIKNTRKFWMSKAQKELLLSSHKLVTVTFTADSTYQLSSAHTAVNIVAVQTGMCSL